MTADRELFLGMGDGKFPTYDPVTSSTASMSEIDLDIVLISELMNKATMEATIDAFKVYELGSSSWPFAELQLSTPLPQMVPKGTPVTGVTRNDDPVEGFVLEYTQEGSEKLNVQYDIKSTKQQHQCLVGGNPNPTTEGCFSTPGMIHIEGLSEGIRYTYDQESDNKNYRSLQRFSTLAHNKMKPCASCKYMEEFSHYVDYYGTPEYADVWIRAAFNGDTMDLNGHGADFSDFDHASRSIAIETAAAFMSTSMFAIRELNDAFWKCQTFYSGSLVETVGSDHGKLTFSLADSMCKAFRTCGKDGDRVKGTAKVNYDVYGLFNTMQANILNGKCPELRRNKDHVVGQMTVPVVQAVLRSAYHRSDSGATKADEAEGATFAAIILPKLNECNHKDARIVYENLKTGSGMTSFVDVKHALERQYDCLGITCEDIGGYYRRSQNDYFQGAEPCITPKSDDDDLDLHRHAPTGLIVFLLIGFSCYFYTRRRLKMRRERLARYDFDNDLSESSSDDIVFT